MVDWLDKKYLDSRAYRLTRVFWEGTRNNFRYSLLGRITEIKEKDNLEIFNNSRLLKWSLGKYKNLKSYNNRIIKRLKTTVIFSSVQAIKKEFRLSPLKICGIIGVTAILINTAASLLLKKEIGLLGWSLRVIFLFLGWSGLFCNASWKDTKRTSFVLKYMNKSP